MTDFTITGRVVDLDDERSVFVGRYDDAENGDGYCIRLRSEDGKYTRLKISDEAAVALVKLLTGKRIGKKLVFPGGIEPDDPKDHEKWQLVRGSTNNKLIFEHVGD